MLDRIRDWLSSEPRTAVAAFGKSAVVNGHQPLAGDATRSLLAFARTVYDDGILPRCRDWEDRVRAAEPVLADRIIRWRDDRLTIARLSAVAEGGSQTLAFAPMVVCAEIEASDGLSRLPEIDAELARAGERIRSTHPREWSSLLAPTRSALPKLDRSGERTSSVSGQSTDAMARSHLERLGAAAPGWVESLWEELGLAVPEGEAGASAWGLRAAPPGALVSRTAPAPRVGPDPAIDLQGWIACIRSAAPHLRQVWMIAGERFATVRIVVGTPLERDLAALWMSAAEAAVGPEPLSQEMRVRVRDESSRWLADVMAGASRP